ncbi:MAG TPA: hypothetical protein P5136_01410 [Methanofastidiosum sp.]|nr:hypothetical protein [Methanofastidiosum sp.]
MYANFYTKNDVCLFSVEVNGEKQAEDLADKLYASDKRIEDWTITEEPISKKILC